MSLPSRFSMSKREKQIEGFYLDIIARILNTKDDETTALRFELSYIADCLAKKSAIK